MSGPMEQNNPSVVLLHKNNLGLFGSGSKQPEGNGQEPTIDYPLDLSPVRRPIVATAETGSYVGQADTDTTTETASYEGNTNIHSGTMFEFKIFNCKLCADAFIKVSYLRRHWETHIIGEGREPPHKCPLCKRRFMSSTYAVRHLRLHMGDSPYRCFLCGEMFWTARLLKGHMTFHKGTVTPFSCSKCGMPYKREYNLRKHMNVCRGEGIPGK